MSDYSIKIDRQRKRYSITFTTGNYNLFCDFVDKAKSVVGDEIFEEYQDAKREQAVQKSENEN